jgi:2-keto-3-deoxy-L-fuconate dehydrogenase
VLTYNIRAEGRREDDDAQAIPDPNESRAVRVPGWAAATVTTGLDGLVAVVTGGASGIGLAAARLLADRGAAVACLDLTTTDVPAPLLGVRCDVTNDETVRAAFETVAREYGRLDILINNAGIGAQGTVADNHLDEWSRVFDVNVYGLVRVTRAALGLLRRSPHAAIVNTCSAVAVIGIPNRALYSASKGAVRALTLAMAADHLADGIRVNSVHPGTTDTAWVTRLLAQSADPQTQRESLLRRQPMGRLVAADEVAAAIAYLASPAAAAITGGEIVVDGGLTTVYRP